MQTELVDHMANDIEQIWLEYPKITFEEARDKSFKKFGVFGFMDVIEAKQKQMDKRYWKLLLRFAKEWFTLPKVITTLLIFLAVFFLMQIPFVEIAIVSVLLILVVFEMIAVYKIRKEHKAKEKTEEKIFLLEAMIGTTKNSFTGFTFINLFNFINLTKFDFSGLNVYWLVLIALTVTVLVIFFYVVTMYCLKKLKN
ncbi:hypothetical protein [Polaribacter sp.]|uniref:hypothetical protein n=1 Tax=Polaribacter sp. TaxID=1920175 RepID=UPI0025F23B11|nr:hypothetical protein [Polaribacter sp.]